MTQTFTIKGRLPGANEYIDACRKSHHAANKQKKDAQASVAWSVKMASIAPVNAPVRLSVKWVEESRRRDLDNIRFGVKFILDALVDAGILKGDGWEHVVGFDDTFDVSMDSPRIEVTMTET